MGFFVSGMIGRFEYYETIISNYSNNMLKKHFLEILSEEDDSTKQREVGS